MNPPGNVVIYNVTMTSADTEYSQALPANTKAITVQCRDGTEMRIAFVTGKVKVPTDPYFTIKANASYSEGKINAGSVTLYMGSDSSGKIAEILCWYGG